MSERLPPEITSSPEYWNGHSFQDDCAWNPPRQRENRPGWISELREINRIRKVTKPILDAFLLIPEKTTIKRFGPGETFDAHNYPPGTVVRFERERLNSERGYYTVTWYGVVFESRLELFRDGDKRILAAFFESWTWGGKVHGGVYEEEPRIEIGKVRHVRTKLQDGWTVERMERTPWLEVWQIGHGIVEDAKKKAPAFKLVEQEG